MQPKSAAQTSELPVRANGGTDARDRGSRLGRGDYSASRPFHCLSSPGPIPRAAPATRQSWPGKAPVCDAAVTFLLVSSSGPSREPEGVLLLWNNQKLLPFQYVVLCSAVRSSVDVGQRGEWPCRAPDCVPRSVSRYFARSQHRAGLSLP